MKVRKTGVGALALTFAVMVLSGIALPGDPPKKTGTPGVIGIAVGTLGCPEHMCGTNHNQVML